MIAPADSVATTALDPGGRPISRTGRVFRRLRWPMVAAWIVLVIALHPLAGTLYRVTNDSAAANLPSAAQSTRVATLIGGTTGANQQKANRQDSIACVFVRAGGLTSRDQAVVASARAAAQRLVGSQRGLSAPGPIRTSTDERAAVFVATVAAPTLNATEIDTSAVTAVRKAITAAVHPDAGLQIAVSGAAAVTADGGSTSQTSLLITALCVVGIVLLLVYGSVLLWIFPLLGALAGIVVAQAATHGLAVAGITVSSLSTSILIVLAFGLASDYALLLIHRYREELATWAAAEDAMAAALRRTVPTLIASAATVAAALACLLAAHSLALNGLGPVGAVAVAGALLAQTTFLPALLLLLGRRLFWPRRAGMTDAAGGSRSWSAIGAFIARRPVRASVGVVVLLGVAAAGLTSFRLDDNPLDNLRDRSDAVAAAELITEHFGPGTIAPLTMLTTPAQASTAEATARTAPHVASVAAAAPTGQWRVYSVTLSVDPYGNDGRAAIVTLRERLARSAPASLVGGDAAVRYDVRNSARRDARVVIPLILIAIFLMVAVLLRAILAPLVLVVTTAASFAASLGAADVLWTHVFGFSGIESQLPLYVFVFMVALGVDYSVFLTARIREEAGRFGNAAGITRGLAATGGVITAAGVVLAATFAALAERPLVDLAEVGTAIAGGVLLDTLLIRTVLVPAALHWVGERAWWPGRLRPAPGMPR